MYLWRIAGSLASEAVTRTSFPDVPRSHPYFRAVLWAQQKGITKGYSNGAKKGMFGIDDSCMRGQIMSFIWRLKSSLPHL